MFCHYLNYRELFTDWLKSAVAHSDECKEMSDCPYIGTNLIQKVPWAGQAGAGGDHQQGTGRQPAAPVTLRPADGEAREPAPGGKT